MTDVTVSEKGHRIDRDREIETQLCEQCIQQSIKK